MKSENPVQDANKIKGLMIVSANLDSSDFTYIRFLAESSRLSLT